MPCNVFSCTSPCYVAQMRYVITVLILFAIITGYCQRVNISIAMVEMVYSRPKAKKGGVCPMPPGKNSTVNANIGGGKRHFSEKVQNYILLSFYIGYIFTNLISGYFCDKYGAKWIIIIGMVISSIGTAIQPILFQKTHWIFSFLNRVMLGLAQGGMYPGATTLLAHWAPTQERATLGAVAYAGNSLGAIIGTLTTGMLIVLLNNWPCVFYIWAFFGVIWCVAASIWIYSTPETHKHLPEAEKTYILENIKIKDAGKSPLLKILADPAQIAITVATIGHTYIIFTMMSNLPKYMNNVLNYDMKQNAVASSMPYLAMYLCSIIGGKLADFLIKKKNYDLRLVRRIYGGLSGYGAGACVLAAGYCNCFGVLALCFFSLGLCFKGLYFCSIKVNPMDITTKYSGMIMSISNGIAAISGVATPFIIGFIAPNNTLAEWHIVYWIVFAVATFTTTFFVFCAQGKRSKWDYTEEEMGEYDARIAAEKKEKQDKKDAKKAAKAAKTAG